jgi:hypothetical protein
VTGDRYVVLGLAPGRAAWFRQVGQWATAAILPAEFVRCVSVAELRARLDSGRPFSAALVDASLPGLDRDLIAAAVDVGTAVLVVDAGSGRDWRDLGAAAVLRAPFSRDELLEVLAATSDPVGAAVLEDPPGPAPATAGSLPGRLVAVTGPGGTGASTVAIALAQGLAGVEGRALARPRVTEAAATADATVVLADLCLVADQAMLHDARVLVPGVQELVEAHRTGVPSPRAVLAQTVEVPVRGYRLLLGLRRQRHWVSLRGRAVDATLDSLQRAADVVVADVDADVEGEAETGSVEVEERNLLARATLARADAVLVVGEPSMKGVHALVRTVGDLLAFGVPIDRCLPVMTGAPRSPRARAERSAAVAELLQSSAGAVGQRVAPPLYLPPRELDAALRDGVARWWSGRSATSPATGPWRAAGRRRRLGDHDQRAGSDLRRSGIGGCRATTTRRSTTTITWCAR